MSCQTLWTFKHLLSGQHLPSPDETEVYRNYHGSDTSAVYYSHPAETGRKSQNLGHRDGVATAYVRCSLANAFCSVSEAEVTVQALRMSPPPPVAIVSVQFVFYEERERKKEEERERER